MSYMILRASDRETLWWPSLNVGIVYVCDLAGNARAFGMDSGLRFDAPPGVAIVEPPGFSDEALIEVEPFAEVVERLMDEYTRTANEVRKTQLAAVLPISIALLRRAGGTVEQLRGTEEPFARADDLRRHMEPDSN